MIGELRGKLEKAKQFALNAKESIQKDRNIFVSQSFINKAVSMSLPKIDKLSDAKFTDVKVCCREGYVEVYGTATKEIKNLIGRKNVTANFELQIEPLDPVWDEEAPKLRFKVEKHKVGVDGATLNILERLSLAIIEKVFKIDLPGKKIRAFADSEGIIHLSIGGLDKRLDAILKIARIKRILSSDDGLKIVVSENVSSSFLSKSKP